MLFFVSVADEICYVGVVGLTRCPVENDDLSEVVDILR
jgi:hypothetical protein